jgi:TorA maturation chaperone TorD
MINHAEMAGARASIYELFVGLFSSLPDEHYLSMVTGDALMSFLKSLSNLESPGFMSGIDHIRAYQSAIKTKSDEDTLTELSVDRTRILRGTGHPDLKPPYEGLYKKNRDIGESLLDVKRFYREAGILPDETVHEPPDYICVELDFMKQLCLREQDQWRSEGDIPETIATEDAFLRKHLGGWVVDFSQQVKRHALTDFYRGFALILEAFVATDMVYLSELKRSFRGKGSSGHMNYG